MSNKESSLTGFSVVFEKEFYDIMRSVRFTVMLILILATAAISLYISAVTIKNYVSEDSFLLLTFFTTSKDSFPSFLSLMSFLIPILGIALGFDAVNKEFSQKTLGRILSQPIFRDVLLFAKALGALGALAIILLSLFLLVIGAGMLAFGVPPTTEQIGRALIFYFITLLYAGIWYILAMLFSIIYKQSSTSAFLSIALWLFLMIFWSPISQLIAYNLSANELRAMNIYSALSNLSPYILFNKAAIAILRPTTRSLGPVMFYQMEGAISGTPLPLSQSLLLIWPQLTEFIALIIFIFTFGYIKFQRKEIRM